MCQNFCICNYATIYLPSKVMPQILDPGLSYHSHRYFQKFLEYLFFSASGFRFSFTLKLVKTKYSRKAVSGVYIKTHFSNTCLSLGCFLDEGKAKQFSPSSGSQHLLAGHVDFFQVIIDSGEEGNKSILILN